MTTESLVTKDVDIQSLHAYVIKTLRLVIYLALAGGVWKLSAHGFAGLPPGHWMFKAVRMCFAVAAAYELLSVGIALVVRMRRGAKGDVMMLTSFARVVGLLAIIVALLSSAGALQQVNAILGAFAGMLLGWSLQAPVSGMAAWVLISLKRPFRIGDRVLFPNLGLSGDVLEIGLMYTKLDQVGGTVGSDEAVGRHVLIPNAMLFSQVAINYTPKQEAAYCLDEVIVRLTYDSDWDQAEKILLDAARAVTAEIMRDTGKGPYIRADSYDYGVNLRLRFMTLANDRPLIAHDILRRIFRDFQHNPRVDFAIPFVYSSRKGLEGGSHGGDRPHEMIEMAVENIEDPDANVPLSTEEEGKVVELAARIRQMGLLQPIVVHRAMDGRYIILAGRMRFLACRHLGWKIIPVVINHQQVEQPGGLPRSHL